MSEEKKEQKIDLKDRMLNEDDLNQVAGGCNLSCELHGHMWIYPNNTEGDLNTLCYCLRCGAYKTI